MKTQLFETGVPQRHEPAFGAILRSSCCEVGLRLQRSSECFVKVERSCCSSAMTAHGTWRLAGHYVIEVDVEVLSVRSRLLLQWVYFGLQMDLDFSAGLG